MSAMQSAVKEALRDVGGLAIGEGQTGIILSLPGWDDLCAKYYKFEYYRHEFDMLQRAYSMGLSVPKPQAECVDYQAFVMDRVKGSDLQALLAMPEHFSFSQEMFIQIVDAVEEFNQWFEHGDLFPRNVMLERWEAEGNCIVAGTPFVIDLERSRLGTSDEWQRMRGWFRGRVAK